MKTLTSIAYLFFVALFGLASTASAIDPVASTVENRLLRVQLPPGQRFDGLPRRSDVVWVKLSRAEGYPSGWFLAAEYTQDGEGLFVEQRKVAFNLASAVTFVLEDGQVRQSASDAKPAKK